MKPRYVTLDKVLDADPRTGQITINGERMILWSTAALGLLRRDLVMTLGLDRAKGFLMRYGWSAGQHDALMVMRAFSDYPIEELIAAGPAMHTVEGIVTVQPGKLEVDEEKGYLSYDGLWLNSFEADEHISCFGFSEQTVCWTLTGYASGYLSTIFKRQVVAIEPKCRGRGEDICTYHALTVEHADERAFAELPYYEDESLVKELERAHDLLQEKNRLLEQVQELQNHINRVLLRQHDLGDLVRVVGEYLARTACVEEPRTGLIAAYWSNAEDEAVWRLWRSSASTRKNATNHVMDVGGIDKYLSQSALVTAGETVGRLVLIGNEPLTEGETLLTGRVEELLSIELFQNRLLLRASHQNEEDVFRLLLEEGAGSSPELTRRYRQFGLLEEANPRIVLVRLDQCSQLEEVLSRLEELKTGHVPFVYKGDCLFAVSKQALIERRAGVPEFLEYVRSTVELRLKGLKTVVTVGRAVQKWAELSQSYKDASDIAGLLVRAGALGAASANTGYFEAFESCLLFIRGAENRELLQMYARIITPLAKTDEERNTGLICTAHEFLGSNGNYAKTAEVLHISVAGLRYRLDKIASLTGTDWSNVNDRVNLYVTLNLHYGLQGRRY